jgi:glycine betaine/proline transport system substrate-binding protein
MHMNSLGKLLKFTCVAACLTLAATSASAQSGRTVKSAVATDDSRFALEVVLLGLEKLGYKPADIATVANQAGYVAVANGDLDLWGEYWDPNHERFFTNAGGDQKLSRLGILVDNAMGAYVIDKKTAEQYKINNIAQLKDPAIAKLFDSDGDGRANLAGCPVGWGCDPISNHHLKEYGLTATVQNDQGDFVLTHTDVVTRFKAGKPVLYYTYAPLWLNQILVPGRDVVFLEVPFTTFPPGLPPRSTILSDGRNTGFAALKIRLVANNEFLVKNPAAKKLFELASIPIADVDAQNLLIYQGEKSYPQIKGHAKRWVSDNAKTFDGWVAEARQAAN